MHYEPVFDFDEPSDNFSLKKAWNSSVGKVVRKVAGTVLDVIPVTSIAKGVIETGIDVGKGIHNAKKRKKQKKEAEEARKRAATGVGVASIGSNMPQRTYEPTIDFGELNEATYWTLKAIE